MRYGINTLDDFQVLGKVVLCRVDINQPVNREKGTLNSISRITACVPTIRELSDKGARLVLLAHQGSDIEYRNFYTTLPHAGVLTDLLGRNVRFVEDVCGPTAREAIRSLQNGEIILLDNVRFCSEEQTLFEEALKLTHEQQAKTEVVRKLAPLANLYICDAFAAAHRDQPSLCGFEQLLPSAMGRLFEREYVVISQLMDKPTRPCVFVLGGAKVSDSFLMMETVLKSGAADSVLAGGLVANILLAANGANIGQGSLNYLKSTGNDRHLPTAKTLYEKYSDRIRVPVSLAWVQDGLRREGSLAEIPFDATVLDISSQAAKEFADAIMNAKTVFVNGPMGVFEEAETEAGTRVVWKALGETKAFTVVGGGDSITATTKYGKTKMIDYICTGGGALIRFLAGEELPVVKALRHAAKAFPCA